MDCFEPIAGIDVAKDKSEVSILGPDNCPWGKSMVLNHSPADFERFLIFLKEVEKRFGCKPVLVCEATGHYHRILVHFFLNKGFKVVVLNPIQSASMKHLNIRKVKSDEVDSLRIAFVYRLKQFKSVEFFSPHTFELKELCHQQVRLVELLTSLKNQTLAVLEQGFPGYEGVFYDTFGVASLKILSHFPSPGDIIRAGIPGLMEVLKTCPGFSLKKMHSKAELLVSKAKESLRLFGFNSTFSSIILSNISLIQAFELQITIIESKTFKLVDSLPDYELLKSIPGIGPVNATQILATIGSISRFQNARQFVAFCGIDPSVKRSGKFNGTKNSMSKRGAPMLRKALYMAALKSICQEKDGSKVNSVLFDYYHEKCKGKPKKVALGAVMHKLAYIIFAVLRDQKPFELRTREQHLSLMALKTMQHSA